MRTRASQRLSQRLGAILSAAYEDLIMTLEQTKSNGLKLLIHQNFTSSSEENRSVCRRITTITNTRA
ncbi:hypothetical protein BIW11_12092 [Tropilaelaps mercedesae]|uniref:Uncharacterized protein n=1 Tax=Tropilaelaps mercedesae TaxID=418985 RepID=A0A1V9X827_9ACAR|nr:hypothetical protein BIW11_12092 [Tropilaelaps mercedesae]